MAEPESTTPYSQRSAKEKIGGYIEQRDKARKQESPAPPDEQAETTLMKDMSPEEVAVGAVLQRRRVRDHAARMQPTQDRFLAQYNREQGQKYTYEDLFAEVKKRPELSQDINVQDIYQFEVQKRFGYDFPDKAKTPVLFHMLEAQEKLKQQGAKEHPPEAYTEFEVEYIDDEGNKQVKTQRRLKKEFETKEGKNERIANAVELSATPEGVLQGMDLGEELEKALYHSASKRVRLPVYKTPKGDIAFDIFDARKKLTQYKYHTALYDAGYPATEIPQATKDKLYERAENSAKKFLAEVRDKNSGVFFVEVDPEGTTQDIIDSPWYKGGRLLAPVRAMLAGAQTADSTYNRKVTRLEEQGWLDYFTNMTPSTVIPAALKAGCWGCEKHIRLLRDGYNIFDDFENVGKIATFKPLERKELAKRTGKEGFVEKAPQMAGGIAATGAIILLEPDPFTVSFALAGAGLGSLVAPGPGTAAGGIIGAATGKAADILHLRKLAKSMGIGKINRKLNQGEKAVGAVDDYIKGLERVASVEESAPRRAAFVALEKDLKLKDPTAYRIIQAMRASELGLNAHYAEHAADAAYNLDVAVSRLATSKGVLAKAETVRDRAQATVRVLADEASTEKAAIAKAKALADEDLTRFRDVLSDASMMGEKANDLSAEEVIKKAREIIGAKALKRKGRGVVGKVANPGFDAMIKVLKRMKPGDPNYKKLVTKLITEAAPRRAAQIAAGKLVQTARALERQQARSKVAFEQLAKESGEAGSEVADMDKVIDKVRPEFVRNEKLANFFGVSTSISKDLRDSLTLTMENFRVARDLAGDSNPLARAVIGSGNDGTAVVDTVKLQAEIINKHGADVVQEFLRRGTLDGEARDVYASFLGDLLSGGGTKRIKPEDLSRLRDSLESLTLKSADGGLTIKGEELGRAYMDEAFAPGGRISSMAGTFRQNVRRAMDLFSPIQSRLGTIKKSVRGIFKVALETDGAIDQELGLLYQMHKTDTEGYTKLLNTYFTTNTPLKLANIPSIMNRGDEVPMQMAARQILSNPRVNERLDELLNGAEVLEGAAAKAPGRGSDALSALSRAWIDDHKVTDPKYASFLEDVTALLLKTQFDEVAAGTRQEFSLTSLMKDLKAITASGVGPGQLDAIRLGAKPPYAMSPRDAVAGLDPRFRKGRMRGEVQFGGLGSATMQDNKAWSFATQALAHAAVLDASGNAVVKTIGGMPPDLAADMNRLIRGEAKDITGGVQRTLDSFAEWGKPFLQTEYRAVKGMGKTIDEFVHLTTTSAGVDVHVPTKLYDAINARMGNIVKSLAIRSEKPSDIMSTGPGQAMLKYLQLYRGSLTTGIIIPNPRYWNNNVFGDFSQMWEVAGLSTAAKLSFQNLPTNLPYGRQVQAALLKFSEANEGVPVLGTWMNAMFNPNLAKFYRKEGDELIRLGDGTMASVKEVRDWMAKDGVLDTFITESVKKNILKKGVGDSEPFFNWVKGGEGLSSWQNKIIQHATFVQQRQRVAFYLEMLHKGKTRDQAREALHKALYDWKAPFSQAEQALLLPQIATFYRFYRLAAIRSFEVLSEAFTAPSAKSISRALIRPTRSIARVRQMGQAVKAPPKINYWYEGMGDQHQAQSDEEYRDAALRDMRFWWQQARPQWWSRPIEDYDKTYQKKWGMDRPYKDVLLPPFTPLDLTSMALGITVGMTSVMAAAAGVPVAEGVVSKAVTEPIAGLGMPVISRMLELYFKSMSRGTHYVGGGRAYLRPGEVIALKRLGAGGTIETDEDQRLYLSGQNKLILNTVRAIPMIGTQIPHHVAAYVNPGWEKDTGKGIELMLLTLLGIQPRYKDPFRDLTFGVREAKQSVEQEVRREEALRRTRIAKEFKREK